MCEIVFVDMGDLGQGIQRDILGVVRINISFGKGTFLGKLLRGRRDDGEILLPGDIDQQNLQDPHAQDIESRLLFLEFPQHGLGKVNHVIFGGGITIGTIVLGRRGVIFPKEKG